jgi:hypothetical protein
VRFDEHAASDELERTRQALEESRQRRKRAAEEFDAFLRSFAPRPSGAAPPASGPPPPPRRLVREAAPPLVLPPERDTAPGQEPPPVSPPTAAAPEIPRVVTALGAAPPPRRRAGLYGAAALAAGAVAIVAWLMRPQAPSPPAGEPAAPAVAPAAQEGPRTPPAAAPAPTAPVRGVNAELRTTRPVWVRVTVDGKPVLERELAADQRLPFPADRTVVIRAGDAGAVHVSINGKDQGALGPDGQVLTRSFSRPD